ncbi:hypothetical protein TNCV_2985851 [Trichonephila clavipes]|nr:hypothetical protein TNCV_2985851 [Trichonephila clavipes]
MKSSCSAHCCNNHWQSEKIVCRIQSLHSLEMEGVSMGHKAQDAFSQAWTCGLFVDPIWWRGTSVFLDVDEVTIEKFLRSGIHLPGNCA